MCERIILFINVILLAICIINSSQVIYRLLNPELPSIQVYETNLADIEFPLSFEICLEELNESEERYKKFGYQNFGYFYFGVSQFNYSLVGWNGHTEDGGTIASTEGWKRRYGARRIILFFCQMKIFIYC